MISFVHELVVTLRRIASFPWRFLRVLGLFYEVRSELLEEVVTSVPDSQQVISEKLPVDAP